MRKIRTLIINIWNVTPVRSSLIQLPIERWTYPRTMMTESEPLYLSTYNFQYSSILISTTACERR